MPTYGNRPQSEMSKSMGSKQRGGSVAPLKKKAEDLELKPDEKERIKMKSYNKDS